MQNRELLPILYQDDAVLAISKPAGLLTIADGYESSLPHVRTLLEPIFGKLWIVHRLDKQTSGVLLLARSAEAHKKLNQQFAARQVRKTYHAVILGVPTWQMTNTSLRLRENVGHKHRTVADPERGKPSQTVFTVLETFDQCTLIEAVPKTGRRHQVRAHLYAIGHPILRDPLYGLPEQAKPMQHLPIQRLALHAYRLEFSHPEGGKRLSISAPYPADFQATIEILRQDLNRK